MNRFSEGDQVVLVNPHTYGNTHYGKEAQVGDEAIITGIRQDGIYVRWTKRIDPDWRGTTTSAVDPECLGHIQAIIYEDAEV